MDTEATETETGGTIATQVITSLTTQIGTIEDTRDITRTMGITHTAGIIAMVDTTIAGVSTTETMIW